MLLTDILILLTIFCCSFYILLKYSKSLTDFRHLPYMKSWLPLIGDIPKILGANKDFYENLMSFADEFREYGLLSIWFGIQPIVFVFKDKYIQDLIGNSVHIEKNMFYTFIKPWLGSGLLTSTGARWLKSRKMLTPSFHYNILNSFQIIMEEHSNILCNKLDKMVGKGEFDIRPYISNFALDVITETAMGKCVNAQIDESSDYIESVKRMSDIAAYRSKSPWLWPDILFNLHPMGREAAKCLKILHDFTKKVIEERTAVYLENLKKKSNDKKDETVGKKKMAFLDGLLDKLHEGEIDKTWLREEVDTFMFEGHDTTAVGIIWTLYFIAAYPNVQKKLHKEIDDCYDATEEHIQQQLKKLVYLDCVIKEVQRISPSVPLIGRVAAEDFKMGTYEIKKGSHITIGISALHKDPQNFPDPETFDPDRFHNENNSDRHPYAFIPFSAGPRNCIGQKFAMLEEKIVLSQILRKFNLETTQQIEDLSPSSELVLKPLNPVSIKLTYR